jgi:hypothetical protein
LPERLVGAVERRAARGAEADGFELLVTTDQKLRYQQNLRARRFAVLVLIVADWPALQPHRGSHRHRRF